MLAFGAAWLSVRAVGGRLLLRVEDLDRGRARAEVARAQREDLQWLGIGWDEEVPAQSTRRYPLDGIPTFRCPCPRARRLAGACRCREEAHAEGAWRFRTPRGFVRFTDRARGPLRLEPDEDPILVRADGEPAYPLAVVVDDARDGVTEVVRGADLLEATATQVVLHRLRGTPEPSWLHVPLLVGEDGKKLSKSHGAAGVRALREAGWGPEQVWSLLLPVLGVEGAGSLAEAAARFEAGRVERGPFRVRAEGARVWLEPDIPAAPPGAVGPPPRPA